MWTVIYMAQDRDNVENIKQLLEKKEVMTRIRALKKSDENYFYELLVPSAEVCCAHGLMLEADF